MSHQLAQASTLATFISSTLGPFNCFSVQPCYIVGIYAIAVCNARRFSYLVRHKQLPPEILLLFGGFQPSQGHGVRMCKFLSSEWHRQPRFY
uniref:Putative tick transposon n=1 Tax=Ixodes scapularis TaxID=6945 RepID=A0A4D5RCL7_IXOSC